jgi:hypothetical protein
MAIGSDAARTTALYAYVIDSSIGRVKIGLSATPLQRVLDLQTGSPVRLSLEHVEPIVNLAPHSVEQTAHSLLEAGLVAWRVVCCNSCPGH